MGDIVAFEQSGEDTAGAEGVRLEGDEDEDWRGERVVVDGEVFVEFGDQAAGEVHDVAFVGRTWNVEAGSLLFLECG